MIEIRIATSADASDLAELRWEFRTSRLPATEPHDAFIRRCAPWMRRELTNAHAWHAWVAVKERRIVGQVWLNTVHKIPNPVAESEMLGYVSNLYVKPSERGGIGTRLVDAALKWSQAHGIDRLVLWPSPRSVTLYLRHGFSHGGEAMELKLPRPR